MAQTTFTPERAVELLTRLARGRSLHSVVRDPDMPSVQTVHVWARKDAVFADHLRAARALGPPCAPRGGRLPSRYTEALARGICDALKAGFTLTDICASDAVPVTVKGVLGWARRRPDFRAAYAAATAPRQTPRGLVIGQGRHGAYTPQRAQAVLDRLLEGRALADICRDPDMPSAATLERWRRRHLDFHLAWQTTRRLQLEVLLDEVLEAADQGRRASPARQVVAALTRKGVEPFSTGVAAAGGVEAWRRAGAEADGEARDDGAAGMGHNWRGR